MFKLHHSSTGSLSGLKSTRNVHLAANGHGYDNVANQKFRNQQRLVRTLSGPKAPSALVGKLPSVNKQGQDLAAGSFARSALEARKFSPTAAALRTVLDMNNKVF